MEAGRRVFKKEYAPLVRRIPYKKNTLYLLCLLQIMIGAELLVSYSKTFLSIFNWLLLYYYSLGTDLIALMFNRRICWRILRHWTFGTLYTHMFFMLDCFPMSLFEQVFIDSPWVFIALLFIWRGVGFIIFLFYFLHFLLRLQGVSSSASMSTQPITR